VMYVSHILLSVFLLSLHSFSLSNETVILNLPELCTSLHRHKLLVWDDCSSLATIDV